MYRVVHAIVLPVQSQKNVKGEKRMVKRVHPQDRVLFKSAKVCVQSTIALYF